MTGWLGTALLVLAAWLLAAGYLRRRRVLAVERGAAPPAEPARPPGRVEFADLGHIAVPLVVGGIVYVGVKSALMYLAVPALRDSVAPFDFAGFMALLAAAALWFAWRVRYNALREAKARQAAATGRDAAAPAADSAAPVKLAA